MDKIYIIEDDENIRNLLKIALEGFGYEAEGFETAEEGLERIKEEVPSLAIFDWMLPGMDGVTAIRKIRQTDGLQELPIMLLTAKEKELDSHLVFWSFLQGYAACCAVQKEKRRRIPLLLKIS